ncbi:MAG TPA: TonB-dependent receptor, partial [Candidatus Baltobacteraceae bacterium]|nr:TonB-dependent receptor [Candidatus Baltobacteraceae bacterium]
MIPRIFAALVAVVVAFVPLTAPAQSQAASLNGRIFDTGGGLPVQGASIELDRGVQKIATATTDANGIFSFNEVPQGEYSVLIVARGFVSTRIPTLFLIDGNTTQVRTAIAATNNQSTNLKEIGRVVVEQNNHSLQASTTINQYIDPAQVQSQAYTHVGYLLARLPGISMHTSPSIGDDMSISIRGFDPSETATLLDGHPIGPIGAFGGANSPGFDFKLAPFWGLSGTSVIMGSGAAGIYGVSTIAGAVDFQTLNPTREAHASFFQGVGDANHSMSGISATGSFGKVGYAIASAAQGSTGQFPGGNITQTANMQASSYCNAGAGAPTCTVPGAGGAQPYSPPDLTSQNAAANTYFVSGAYTQRNNLVKFNFNLSPRTQIQTAFFDATTWNDKTGNGDQDALSYATVLGNASSILSGGNNNFTYNGAPTTCSGTTIAVL